MNTVYEIFNKTNGYKNGHVTHYKEKNQGNL